MISLGLLALLLSYVDVGAALSVLGNVDPWLILLSVLLIVAGRILIAHRWHLLVRVANPEVGFGALLRLTFVSGFLGFATPGAVGVELVRLYGLARGTGMAVPHPDPEAPVEAWDPLPTELAAYQALTALPDVRGVTAVGHSMGRGSVLRLLGAEVPLAFGVVLGAGLTTGTEEEAAYWDQRFLDDRRIGDPLPPGHVRAIRERYYDTGRYLAALSSGHAPVYLVNFGIEWPNIVAARDAFYAQVPGNKDTWQLPESTHYLSAEDVRTFGLVIGDTRATRAFAARLGDLVEQAA